MGGTGGGGGGGGARREEAVPGGVACTECRVLVAAHVVGTAVQTQNAIALVAEDKNAEIAKLIIKPLALQSSSKSQRRVMD